MLIQSGFADLWNKRKLHNFVKLTMLFDAMRERIGPAIAAAATMLVTFSIVLLATVDPLRHRVRRLQARHG